MGLLTPVELPPPGRAGRGALHRHRRLGDERDRLDDAWPRASRSAAATGRTPNTCGRWRLRGRASTSATGPSSLVMRSTVVASSAIREDNPELAEARRRGLRVLHRSAALGSLMLGRRGIAVAGTHGKTTTTAMIASCTERLRIRPVVRHRRRAHRHRRPVATSAAGTSWSSRRTRVTAPSCSTRAEVAVVTNVDPDHLSNWGTCGELRRRLPALRDRGFASAAGDQRR